MQKYTFSMLKVNSTVETCLLQSLFQNCFVKMSKTPIILKKEDSQSSSRVQSKQPKILTKSTNKENASTAPQPAAPEIPCPQMKTYKRLLQPPFQLNTKVLDYLESDNSDFLVVGIVGKSNVGKSTLMNIIANPDFLTVSEDSKTFKFGTDHPFSTEVAYEGNTIDMFITTDRIIFLDTSPLLANFQRRDMVNSDCGDIEMLLMLSQLCHLILVVNDRFPDISVLRLLALADQMIPAPITHRASFVHIANRVQPGTRVLNLDSRVQNGAKISVPDLYHPGNCLHHDVAQIIQELQEKVFMMKRVFMNSDEEIFTEKKWGQLLISVHDQMKNNYFLRKYEALKDKFHQPIENS